MKPLRVRLSILGSVPVGIAGVLGYLGSSPSPSPAQAATILLAALIPGVAFALVAADTNRRIRGSGLEGRPPGPLWGPPGSIGGRG